MAKAKPSTFATVGTRRRGTGTKVFTACVAKTTAGTAINESQKFVCIVGKGSNRTHLPFFIFILLFPYFDHYHIKKGVPFARHSSSWLIQARSSYDDEQNKQYNNQRKIVNVTAASAVTHNQVTSLTGANLSYEPNVLFVWDNGGGIEKWINGLF